MARNSRTYEVTDRYVVEFELNCIEDELRELLWISNQEHFLKTKLIKHVLNNFKNLSSRRKYKRLLKKYGKLCDKLSKLNEQSIQYKQIKKQKKEVENKLNTLYKEYHLTTTDLRKIAIEFVNKHPIHSVFALSIVEDIDQAMNDLLYGKGETLHFKSKNKDIPSIRAKRINRAIIPKIDKNGIFKIIVGQADKSNHQKIVLTLKKFESHDFFLMDEYHQLVHYLKNDDKIDNHAKELYKKTGIKQETHRPCFAKIVFKQIRHKLRVFVQFTIVGIPTTKKDRHYHKRNFLGEGRIGGDFGTQTFAGVAEKYVIATNLAERNNKSTRSSEKIICKLLRKMDRSRRLSNPKNYNEDGTVKKGKKTWIKTNNYKKLEYKLKEQYRRDALSRKYAIQELANDLREHGDILITEENNFKALQKCSKTTKLSKKTKIITDKNGNQKNITYFVSKKRYGKSLLYRCPGKLMQDCERKFKKVIKVDKMFRASQYDHTSKTYIKKELSDRRFMLSNGVIVQRDLYSAFLLYCSDYDYKSPSQNQCDLCFDEFYKEFVKFEKYVKNNHIKILNYN